MQITVTHNVKAARASLKNYQKKQLPNAVRKALNLALRGMLTDTKNLVGKKLNLKAGEIAKELIPKPASQKSGNAYRATMIVKGGLKKNLASFKGLSKTKKGLSGQIWEKRTKYPGAFKWEREIASGDISATVFRRVKGADKVIPKRGSYKPRRIKRGPRAGEPIKRQPIVPIFGDSVVGVFTQKGRGPSVQKELQETVPPRFVKALEHEISRINK